MAVHRHSAGSPLNADLSMTKIDSSLNDSLVLQSDLANEVGTGLTQTPKRLPSRFFYDDEGSRLFAEIMHLPEYYLTRSEYEILDTNQAELLRLFAADGRPFELIELGAGDGLKTKILLNHFWSQQADFTYVPVDISQAAIDNLTADIRKKWPQLAIQPRHDDYFNAIEQLSNRSDSLQNRPRLVVLFLGSNIGNFSPTEARDFFRQISQSLQPGDLVLTGFDLQKHPAVIHAAYNDRQGLTRAFNLNLLRRINRELGANFDLSAFDHYEMYHPETGEARSYLVSQKEQTVAIRDLNLTVPFGYGEIIHTEISRKFTREGIAQLAEQSGFELTNWFTDCKHYFADVIFRK
ncbi:L-histidine N(alpha)-methyltransferase [Larkinella punicea]|uniref:L-histidine N(Alpha)-methyltransferase n=2 Tax=Larkinella punicea TaxID=2315727 RepID=A0A368JS82_9BACT|nr:L-histidine N(alpha)-methyltransferase [Larkinella punicea]